MTYSKSNTDETKNKSRKLEDQEMSNYRTIKLFLTACEYDEAQTTLARIARRKTYTETAHVAKQSEMRDTMRRRDDLAEEIQKLQG